MIIMKKSVTGRRLFVLFIVLLVAPLCCYLLIPTGNQHVEKEFFKHIPVTVAVTKKNETEDVVEAPMKDRPRRLPATQEATNKHKPEDVAETDELKDTLPQSVIGGVKTLIFFLAFSHSGHSIVASLMDGHPHMVVSHEFDLFTQLTRKRPSPTKSEIFNALWNNTRRSVINGPRAENATRKGYTLFIDGLYQGKYVDYVDVIGDKKGQGTIEMLLWDPDEWLRVLNILKSLNTTLKMINVIRNPYDTIATSVLFMSKERSIGFGYIKQWNETHEVNSRIIMQEISHYFSLHKATLYAKEKYKLDTIEIHSKDLIIDPKGTLLKICNSLAVTCSNEYLEICNFKIFKSESRTRHLVKWTDTQLQMIQQNIDKYSNLKGYSFDSL